MFFLYNIIYCNNNRGCAITMQTTRQHKDDLLMYAESLGSEFHNDIECGKKEC